MPFEVDHPEVIPLLGTMPDRAIAEKYDVTPVTIHKVRKRLGVAAWGNTGNGRRKQRSRKAKAKAWLVESSSGVGTGFLLFDSPPTAHVTFNESGVETMSPIQNLCVFGNDEVLKELLDIAQKSGTDTLVVELQKSELDRLLAPLRKAISG